jgi:hypothetical protein
MECIVLYADEAGKTCLLRQFCTREKKIMTKKKEEEKGKRRETTTTHRVFQNVTTDVTMFFSRVSRRRKFRHSNPFFEI